MTKQLPLALARNGIKEGNKMPHISIKMYPGRTDDTKKKIAEKVRDCLVEEMQMEPKYFSVSVEDIEKSDWQKEVVDQLKEEELYIKADF